MTRAVPPLFENDLISIIASDWSLSAHRDLGAEFHFSGVHRTALAMAHIKHFLRQISTGSAPAFRALIMGPPGGGKGTISERLTKDFKISVLGSGDMIRSQIRNKTPIGLEAAALVNNGQLVPDEVMMQLVFKELESFGGKSLLLDGFPRTVVQAKNLDAQFPVDFVLNIDVPFDTIVDRLKDRLYHLPSGRIYNAAFNPPKVPGVDDVTGEKLATRDDDKPEVVRARLQRYLEATAPLIDYYKAKGVLAAFTGTETNKIYPLVHKYVSTRCA